MASALLCAPPVAASQWLYFVGFLLSNVATWLLRDYGAPALNFSPVNDCITGAAAAAGDTSCLAQAAVLRVTFGNFMFFALHMLLLLGVSRKSNWRLLIHTSLWPVQILLWAGLVGSTFAMPNSMFAGWGDAARVFSAFFILLQLIILLDFVYSVNEWLLERDHCAFALIAGSGLMICGSLVGIGFLFKYYAPSAGCSLNIFFLVACLLLFLVYAVLSVSSLRNESAGLFTSAAVLAYSTYYVWSALNSEPLSAECAGASSGQNRAIQIVGFVMAMVLIAFTTMSGGTASNAFDMGSDGQIDDDHLKYRPDFFHLMFTLASCYMAMIFSGWDLETQQGEFTVDRGWGSTWVKEAASWICCLMYIWSLVAHHIFRDRAFR